MSNAAALYSLAHLSEVKALLEDLAPLRVDLYEHTYSPASFGSWALTFGRGHLRYRFAWDGRESLLYVSSATVPHSGAAVPWEESPASPIRLTSLEALKSAQSTLQQAYAV